MRSSNPNPYLAWARALQFHEWNELRKRFELEKAIIYSGGRPITVVDNLCEHVNKLLKI